MMVRKMLFIGFIIFLSIIPFFNCSADSPTYDAAYFKQFAPGQPQQITVQSRYPSGILEVCRAPDVYSMYNNPDDPKMNKDILLPKYARFVAASLAEFYTSQDLTIKKDQRCGRVIAILKSLKTGTSIDDIMGVTFEAGFGDKWGVTAQIDSGFHQPMPSPQVYIAPQRQQEYHSVVQWNIYH